MLKRQFEFSQGSLKSTNFYPEDFNFVIENNNREQSKWYLEVKGVYLYSKVRILLQCSYFDEGIKEEDAYKRIKESFKDVAKDLNIEESTVRDKCTRQLGITTEEFCKLVIDYMTGKNDEFENVILRNAKNLDNYDNILYDLNKIR